MMSAPASTKFWCSAGDLLRRRLVQQLRRLAGLQPHGEQIGAGGAVGEQHAFFGKQGVDRIGHGNALSSSGVEIRI